MHERGTRCRVRIGTIAVLAMLTGCGDARIAKLTLGISRDSVLKILGEGGDAGDSLPHVYREERYLSGGKQIDVLFYTSENAKAPSPGPLGGPAPEGPVAEKDLTPIVLLDGKVVGWGRKTYDSTAKAVGFQVTPK